jgi:hypothetical protein
METIAYFKINPDFTISNNDSSSEEGILEKKLFRWSLDISNIQKYQNEYFIFVAVSRIDVDEDMKGEHRDVNNNDMKGKHHDDNENDDCDKCKQYEKGPLKSNESQLSPDDTKDKSSLEDIKVEMQPLRKGTAI